MTSSPDFGIPYIASQQAQPEITHNEALNLIQSILNGVIDVGVNSPPGGPEEGDSYIVGESPSGAWGGRANCIASFFGTGWIFLPGLDEDGLPIAMGARQEGLTVWVRNQQAQYVWADIGSPSMGLAWSKLEGGSVAPGAVDTVNDVDPDSSGNVDLTGAVRFQDMEAAAVQLAGESPTDDDADDALPTVARAKELAIQYGGGGGSSFTSLGDTPANYDDAAGLLLTVTDAEDGVEFSSAMSLKQFDPFFGGAWKGHVAYPDVEPQFWLRSSGTVVTPGADPWWGGCLAPNGKIYGAPYNQTDVIVIDTVAGPSGDSLTDFGLTLPGSGGFFGAVLGADGRVYMCPYNAEDVLIIHPVSESAVLEDFGLSGMGDSGKWVAGACGKNGKIYCPPVAASDCLVIDTLSGTAVRTDFGLTLSGATQYARAVLGADDKIYCIPSGATEVLVIDPATDTAVLDDFGLSLPGSNAFLGGAMAHNGKIYCLPYTATDVLVIDTVNGGAVLTDFGITLPGAASWFGGGLAHDGKIYGAFYNATNDDVLVIDPFSETAEIKSFLGSESGRTSDFICGFDGGLYGIPNSNTGGIPTLGPFPVPLDRQCLLSPHMNCG